MLCGYLSGILNTLDDNNHFQACMYTIPARALYMFGECKVVTQKNIFFLPRSPFCLFWWMKLNNFVFLYNKCDEVRYIAIVLPQIPLVFLIFFKCVFFEKKCGNFLKIFLILDPGERNWTKKLQPKTQRIFRATSFFHGHPLKMSFFPYSRHKNERKVMALKPYFWTSF